MYNLNSIFKYFVICSLIVLKGRKNQYDNNNNIYYHSQTTTSTFKTNVNALGGPKIRDELMMCGEKERERESKKKKSY